MNTYRVRTGLTAGILAVLFSLALSARAQDDILSVDERFATMKADLKLTPAQADSVKPILAEFAAKRQQVRDDAKSQVLIDENAMRKQMDQIREEENQKLSGVLTADQMKQWKSKQQLSNIFNRGQSRDTGWDPKGNGMNPGINF